MLLGNSIAAKVGATTAKAIASSTATARQFLCYQDITISSAISGAVSLIKKGVGNLLLTGANTYSGETKIEQGKISIQKTNGAVTAAAVFEVNPTVTPIIQALTVTFNSVPVENSTFKFFPSSTVPAFTGVITLVNAAFRRSSFNATNSTLTIFAVGQTILTSVTDVITPYSYDQIEANWKEGNSTIRAVSIGDGVTSIGSAAFKTCININSVIIPSSVIVIGDDAFFGCSSLPNITIGDGVTIINNQAFANCTSLTNVTIPLNVTTLGVGIFNGCTGLLSINAASNSLYFSSIGGVLFNLAKTLLVQYPVGNSVSYTIPSTVISIGNQSFSGSTKITSVIIPTSVTNIGNQAFSECKVLTTCFLSINVRTIGIGIFKQCSALTDIAVDANNPYFLVTGGVLFNKPVFPATLPNTLVMFPAGKTGTYAIPNNITTIQSQAFNGAAKLTSITISNNTITTIDNAVFQGCNSILLFTVPNGVTSIGENAFRGCNKLMTVTLPTTGLTSILTQAFYQCPSLSSITIPSTVTSIGVGAFQLCEKLIIINCNVSRTVMNVSNALLGTATAGPTFTPTINVQINDPSWTPGADTIGGRAVIVVKSLS